MIGKNPKEFKGIMPLDSRYKLAAIGARNVARAEQRKVKAA